MKSSTNKKDNLLNQQVVCVFYRNAPEFPLIVTNQDDRYKES